MRRLPLLAIAAALLAAAGSARANVREKSNSGLCLWWKARQIGYRVNDFSVNGADQVCAQAPSSAAAIVHPQVTASFTTWTQAGAPGAVCTDLQLHFLGPDPSTNTGNDGKNLVIWRRGQCSNTAIVPGNDPCIDAHGCADKYNCWDHSDPGVIALTTTSYATATGEIVDADMELDAWYPPGASTGTGTNGFYFTCVDPPATQGCSDGQTNCIEIDVRNTVTHEAGHVIGLGHTCPSATTCPNPAAAAAVMAPTATAGETSKRVLTADDIAGVCAIYPAGQATDTCGQDPGAKSGCGCSSVGPEGLLGLAGLLALRRRRVRR